MFQVYDKYDSTVYTVYDVDYNDGIIVESTKFLIYKDNEWEWVYASGYKPVDE